MNRIKICIVVPMILGFTYLAYPKSSIVVRDQPVTNQIEIKKVVFNNKRGGFVLIIHKSRQGETLIYDTSYLSPGTHADIYAFYGFLEKQQQDQRPKQGDRLTARLYEDTNNNLRFDFTKLVPVTDLFGFPIESLFTLR